MIFSGATGTQIEISDQDLIARACKNARAKNFNDVKRPRWHVVMDVFGVGRIVATQLCKHFNLDPEEMV